MATVALEGDRVAELGIRLISADNHINEPRNLFVDRFPAHLKDKAPRVIQGRDGGDGWSIDGSCPSMWCKFGCGQRAAFSGGLLCNL